MSTRIRLRSFAAQVKGELGATGMLLAVAKASALVAALVLLTPNAVLPDFVRF